jgi:hypothetical protein
MSGSGQKLPFLTRASRCPGARRKHFDVHLESLTLHILFAACGDTSGP